MQQTLYRRRHAMCERRIASRTMLNGAEMMTAQLEMVVDPAVGGEETLR
jgi:hypothetical protein